MKDRFTAFNISSMDIKIVRGLRRTSTPIVPMVNRIALTIKYHVIGIPCIYSSDLAGLLLPVARLSSTLAPQNHRPQQSHNDQQAGNFKRKSKAVEERHAKGFSVAQLCDVLN